MRYRLPYWLKLFRMLVEEYGLPAVDGHDTNVGPDALLPASSR